VKGIAVGETFNAVNKNFGEIFSSLLPGAHARLALVNPECIKEGMQIQVGFNGHWRESLSELSGG